ncbi:MAG: efflux RND transporter permease subunit [Chitinivibrionales bacterium]|nr:efflux RND transporter permease subunit [Chitinivibrionales bacterium]
MNLSAIFIRRPVMTTLVMMGILIFGIVAYNALPVSDLPTVDFPTILVTASLPGATPETMAAAVATPLERQFTTIAGISSMSSTSRAGVTQITVQFVLSRNIDAAAQDIQSAIAVAQRQLPPNMPAPPSYRKVNPADQPILYIALTSPTLPIYALDEYGETMLSEEISMVDGVAQVLVYGSQKYAVRVQIDPNALASRNLGIDDVQNAVNAANVNLPTGTLYGATKAYTVLATGQLLNAEAYKKIIVAYRNGRPVRLGELGEVVDGVQDSKTAAWFINQRGIILAIQRQPGTNTVAVANAVKALLPSFRSKLPAAVDLQVLYDRSEGVKASVLDVKRSLLIALALVILVIFIFLRNFSATLIPSLALPLSLIGTFAIMWRLGYSLDNLSLMALTLSIGFVVDDAIVMLENIVRHIELGEPPLTAALNGSREISFTILSMTLSLVAVFIPVLFLGGIIGRLFHEFAVTIAVAILISGFVSLSLTPMLAGRLLRPPGEVRHGKLFLTTENAFNNLRTLYGRGLDWSLDNRRLVAVASIVVLALTLLLYVKIPKGFFPSEDTGRLIGVAQGPEGISFDAMKAHQLAAASVIRGDPNIAAFMASVGGFLASNQGFLFMHLTPASQRKLTPDLIIQELRTKLSQIPGFKVFLQNPPSISFGATLSQSQYQYTLQGTDPAKLFQAAQQMTEQMRKIKGLEDVTSDLLIRNPQVNITIDRDKASSLGITADKIETALAGAYSSGQISTIYAPNNEYWVILELLPKYQLDPANLTSLYIHSSTGRLVPLNAVASIGQNIGPASVNHLGQLPSVTISFNLAPGFALGTAVDQVQRLGREIIPGGIVTSFQGTAQAFQSSFQGLGLLLLMAILVIYLVLGILYESFFHPVTILSALPFAGFGALVTLLIFNVQLSIYAFVGIIMLIGLVKKNGIMMIDFAQHAQHDEGKSPREAIVAACLVRFRPIMMTTMSALMGTLPIAIGLGAGSESRRPLGIAVVGGLLFSQFLTLLSRRFFISTWRDFRMVCIKCFGRAISASANCNAIRST